MGIRRLLAVLAAAAFAGQAGGVGAGILSESFEGLVELSGGRDGELARIREDARAARDVLRADIARIDTALDEEALLLRNGPGDLMVVTPDETESFASAALLQLALDDADARRTHIERLRAAAGLDYQLHQAIYTVAREMAFDRDLRGRLATMTIEERIDTVLGMFTNLLFDFDEDMRAELADRRDMLAEEVAGLGRVIERADPDAVFVPAAPEAPEGFLSEEGYWVVQISGSGWRKSYGATDVFLRGYTNILVTVAEDADTIDFEGANWSVPAGTDIFAVFEMRREQEMKEAVAACKALPSLCPCAAAPPIWDGASSFDIVGGPYEWTKARAVRGNPRNNLRQDSAHQWHGERRKDEGRIAACKALGVTSE